MKTITINNKQVELTNEALEELTKVELMAHCDIIKLKLRTGKITKAEIVDEILDHYEDQPVTTATQPVQPETPTDQPEPISAPEVTPEPAEPVAAPEPEVIDNTPSPLNAPAGMVYCKHCMKHVKASSAVPTSELGVYICLMGCKAGKPNNMLDKAKTASQEARIKATPKAKPTSAPRKTMFADTDIITGIMFRKVKEGSFSAVTYNMLVDGMTVKSFCDQVNAANKAGLCGTIKGRSDLAFHVEKGLVTIVTPEQYAADNAPEVEPEA